MVNTRFIKSALVAMGLFVSLTSSGVHATTVLYTQNFENPNPGSFVNNGGDVNIYNPINALYGNQPTGFLFAQDYTVEALLVGGTQAWNTGFLDPQNKAGKHVVSMLSSAQNDLLALSFNVGAYKFLNFQVDISSIDLDRWGGPFVPNGGIAPVFNFSLYDNPSGGVATVHSNLTLLASASVTGTSTPFKNIFDWTNHTVALDATGNTNGNVILQIDEVIGGYAALDNFIIAASDKPKDVGVPEPSSLLLLGFGMLAMGLRLRRRSR